ncbi:uracil-DNA glycosylase family protein [Sorangium sp. So ce375]|uniref:uracil-DNA glycosylase family protein n=1 Tax=Sorangium sp. So ce375 TaxID=3133306 RepID=UPI003F5C0B5D
MPEPSLDVLQAFRSDASACAVCHDHGWLHFQPDGRRARPLFHLESSIRRRLLFVFEAPNLADTYEPDKGRMTCDPDTDPTGRFMLELLAHVGLTPSDVVFTNAVLCLPAARGGKFPVSSGQLNACLPWLERLIADVDPKVVVTSGAQALSAVDRLERHGLRLRQHAGRTHPWLGRMLLPLYHPSALGRVSRSRAEQLADIEALLPILATDEAI